MGTPAAKEEAAADQRAGKKLQVDEFVLSNVKVNVALSALGGKPLTVALEGFEGIFGIVKKKFPVPGFDDPDRIPFGLVVGFAVGNDGEGVIRGRLAGGLDVHAEKVVDKRRFSR